MICIFFYFNIQLRYLYEFDILLLYGKLQRTVYLFTQIHIFVKIDKGTPKQKFVLLTKDYNKCQPFSISYKYTKIRGLLTSNSYQISFF